LAFIGCIQAGMFGLVGEKYPFVQGVVTAFTFIEAYVILPRWNRRITEGKSDGTVLRLSRPFHEKAGPCQEFFALFHIFSFHNFFSVQLSRLCRHPSIRTHS
jgi:hypothetical protein